MKAVMAVVADMAKSFDTCGTFVSKAGTQIQTPYFSDTSDVLFAVLLAKAEILVQAKADIVAIKPEGAFAKL